MFRRRTVVCLCFLVLSLAAELPASAQSRALVVAIRTGFDNESGDTITRAQVVDAVTATLSVMNNKEPDPAVSRLLEKSTSKYVKDITASDFQAYKKLVNPESPLLSLPTRKTEHLELRQLPSIVPSWEISLLGAVPRQIDDMVLNLVNDAGELKALTLKPTLMPEDPLTMTQLGTYALRLGKDVLDGLSAGKNVDANWRITEYEANVSTLDMKKEKLKGPWIQGDNYYLIRLDGIDHHRDLFANIIRDRNLVGGVALDVFNVGEIATLALGDAGVTEDGTEEFFEDNKITITALPLSKTKCTRAWILFPLTKEQAESEMTKLNNLGLGQIPNEIRKTRPVMAADTALIKPEDSGRWYELPRVIAATAQAPPNSFQRDLYLANLEKSKAQPSDFQKLLTAYPQAYRVTVYEFENELGAVRNSPRYTIRSEQGGKKQQPANATEVKPWNAKLSQLARGAGDQ